MADHPTVLLWAQMSDPDTAVREKAIRRHEQSLWARQRDRYEQRCTAYEERIATLEARVRELKAKLNERDQAA